MSEHAAEALAGRLRDLHLPEPIGWWPPAPGWWIALTVASIAAVVLTRLARRRRAARAPTLRETLDACYADWQRDRDTPRYHDRVARRLRRAALGLGDDPPVARLAGERWAQWLAARAPLSGATRAALADGRYRREPPETVAELHAELLRCASALESADDAPLTDTRTADA